MTNWILHGFQKLPLPVPSPMFRKHNYTLLVCLMFIQFWLYPNSTKSPGFACYPGGTPSCSSCSATGTQSAAIQRVSTCVPHWESCFLFPFQVCYSRRKSRLRSSLNSSQGVQHRWLLNKCLLWEAGHFLWGRHSIFGKGSLKSMNPPSS